MIVFHGSVLEIKHPDTLHSKKYLDFGQGFYLTTYQNQAERWAIRKSMRSGKTPIVNIYDFQESMDGLQILRFQNDNEEWLDFVCECRRGGDRYKSYDVVIGAVADDDVFKTVDMYFRGIWDKKKTIQELRYYRKSDQIAIVNQKVIDDLLNFRDSYIVEVNS